jgi:hypothetical protein
MSWLSSLFGGGKDNSGDILRQQEIDRQNRITQGTGQINATFAGYNDPFYDGIKQRYLDAYYPQIDKQYKDGQEQTTFGLSRQGLLDSSVGAQQSAKLLEAFQQARLSAADRAQGAANTMRGNIEGARADALSLLSSTADPATAAAVAASRAKAASQPAAYDVLGNIFGQTTGLIMNNEIARNQYGKQGAGFSLFGSQGSGKIFG